MTEAETSAGLSYSHEPLSRTYGVVLFDLDGVVYLQAEPIPAVPEALRRLRTEGVRCAFVTNNASRSAAEVAAGLRARGVAAEDSEVRTSAQEAAAILRERNPAGGRVLVVGSRALRDEVSACGFDPVDSTGGKPVVAVTQGFGSEVGWPQLADAAVTARSGTLWVATNTDRTMPSERGPLPGNGTLVDVVATAAGRRPDVVAGKPSPRLLSRAADGHPASNTLMIGDRWDTDIAAARSAAMPGLLVLSGSTGPREVLGIPEWGRPSYLAWTAAGVHDSHPRVDVTRSAVMCREWTVTDDGAELRLRGTGDAIDALRALAQAAWRGSGGEFAVRAEGDTARRVLRELELGE